MEDSQIAVVTSKAMWETEQDLESRRERMSGYRLTTLALVLTSALAVNLGARPGGQSSSSTQRPVVGASTVAPSAPSVAGCPTGSCDG